MELTVASKTELTRRSEIFALQDALLQQEGALGATDFHVEHHFAPGSYGRVMHLPKGLLVVGKIHKHSHINVISMGKVQVYTEQDGLLELEAPVTFVSHAYTKRVVLALEDTVWTTVHVTDKTDLAEIEAEVIDTEYIE